MSRFPQGDAAYERRYIAAFKELTRLMCSPHWPNTDLQRRIAGNVQWTEMFNALIEHPDDQKEDGDGG